MRVDGGGTWPAVVKGRMGDVRVRARAAAPIGYALSRGVPRPRRDDLAKTDPSRVSGRVGLAVGFLVVTRW